MALDDEEDIQWLFELGDTDPPDLPQEIEVEGNLSKTTGTPVVNMTCDNLRARSDNEGLAEKVPIGSHYNLRSKSFRKHRLSAHQTYSDGSLND